MVPANPLERRRYAARRLPVLVETGVSDPWPGEYHPLPSFRPATSMPSTFGLTRSEIATETRRLLAAGWSRLEVEDRLPVRVVNARHLPLEPIGSAALTWHETG